jgi:hypothetical protein
MTFGLQFQPGVAQNGNGNANGTRGRYQEPVQVLTTRMPKFFGAQSIAPAMLLQAQGGMGQPAARGNVVAQALAQLAGLPPSMLPSPPPNPSVPPSAPQGAAQWDSWIGRERNLPGGAASAQSVQRAAPPLGAPSPQPPPTIPAPHVGIGQQPPGDESGGGGPINPPLPPPFVGPIFPTPPPAPTPQPRPDVEAIQAIADQLFRKFQPQRGNAAFMRDGF